MDKALHMAQQPHQQITFSHIFLIFISSFHYFNLLVLFYITSVMFVNFYIFKKSMPIILTMNN